MSSERAYPYEPVEVSPPGETLRDTLESLGISQVDVAARTGRSAKLVSEIINGKAALTPEMALQLEHVLGAPAAFWNNREQRYREYLARAAEKSRLEAHVRWLEAFPVAQMVRWDWIRKETDAVEQIRELLRFFGVASPDEWGCVYRAALSAQYRQSSKSRVDPAAVVAWLRQGEIEGRRIECGEYSASAFRSALLSVRALTRLGPDQFVPELRDRCAACGVAVVFVPELRNTGIWGATRWLPSGTGLLSLSLRYKSDDHLWFTFYHEAAHILLHGKRLDFLEGRLDTKDRAKEDEANEYAANTLIRPSSYESFRKATPHLSKQAIRAFARDVGIAPGIIVGRLQHDGLLPPSHCNELKRRFQWATD